MDSIPQERNVESFDSGCKRSVETEFSNLPHSDFQDNFGVLNLKVNDSIPVPKFEFNTLKCFDELGESKFSQVCLIYIFLVILLHFDKCIPFQC